MGHGAQQPINKPYFPLGRFTTVLLLPYLATILLEQNFTTRVVVVVGLVMFRPKNRNYVLAQSVKDTSYGDVDNVAQSERDTPSWKGNIVP